MECDRCIAKSAGTQPSWRGRSVRDCQLELRGTALGELTIAHLLEMRSGIRCVEGIFSMERRAASLLPA
jgi:hypothetical protein